MARAPKIEEERKPHDALDGAPLPRQTATLIGHAAAEHALLDAYRSGRMHHGWIVSGERGIGKATLAFRLARFIFAHPDPGAPEVLQATALSVPVDHPAARRVSAGAHPNLLHVQREWNEKSSKYRTGISVDTIRRINQFLGNTAGEEGWRVVIVDPADDLNQNASNALLKRLEEPPRQTMFLLLARSRGALAPTILSRCRVLQLDPLSAAEADAVVRSLGASPAEERDDGLAAALSGGSVRRLYEMQRNDGVTLYRLMLRAIEAGESEAQNKLAAMAGEAAVTEQLLELFEGYVGRRIRGIPEPVAASRPPERPLVTWAELWEKATLSGQEVETYNLDRRHFVLDLLESAASRRSPGSD